MSQLDRGLQPERTLLSWSRTALSIVVNSLLTIRSGYMHNYNYLMIFGFLLLLCSGLLIIAIAHRSVNILQIMHKSKKTYYSLPMIISLLSCLACMGGLFIVYNG